MNEAWHRRNPIPKNPTEAQRIDWHTRHAAACGCREIPAKLRSRVGKSRPGR